MMDWKKLLAVPATLLLLLVAMTACKKEEAEETTGQSMSGEVDFSIPYYVLKGETVTMTASGIIDPREVTYKWYISGLYLDTLNSRTITVRFPDSLGVFTVTATSYAYDYYTSSMSHTVTTVDTSYNASLQNVPRSGQSFVDPRDGKEYAYVSLGDLDWFSQNLAYDSEGSLPYMDSPSTTSLFGAVYTWNEASDPEVCPEGWRVPDNADWESLGTFMAGKPVSFLDDWAGLGEKASAGALLNEERMWPFSPDNAHTNDFGWNALPLGITTREAEEWSGVNKYGYWWSASEKNPDQGYYRYIHYDRDAFPVGFGSKSGIRIGVRCVRTRPQS